MRLRDDWWGRDSLCSPSTTQHNFSFFEIRIFENYMFEQILKVTNMYLFWRWCVRNIIDKKDLLGSPSTTQHDFYFFEIRIFENYVLTNFEIDKYVFILKRMRLRGYCWGRDLLCSPSTTQHNFYFFEIRIFENYVLTNFEINKYVFILKRMRLRDDWWGRDSLCSPSTTQHNFSFFEIRNFENCMFKQILKLRNMYLFLKGCVWEVIVEEEIYCAHLAQLSTPFLFSKFAFLKIISLNKFWNWQICIYYEKDVSER